MDFIAQEKEKIIRAIKAFEQEFGCYICIHDYTGGIGENIPELPRFHLNPFCTVLKLKNESLATSCMAFDGLAVQRHLTFNPEPFMKVCHCFLLEAVIPIYIFQRLSGVIFAGPFRGSAGMASNKILSPAKSPAFKMPPDGFKSLHEIDHRKIRSALDLGELIGDRIGAFITNLQADQQRSRVRGRAETIMTFIDRRFMDNISIGDLANELCLSSSRTSQLLQSLFGKSFPALLNASRLENAATLLRRTVFNVDTVAGYSGFPDQAYFHRVFRKNFKMTPKQYRVKSKSNTALFEE